VSSVDVSIVAIVDMTYFVSCLFVANKDIVPDCVHQFYGCGRREC
jgi:hypothetical protein